MRSISPALIKPIMIVGSIVGAALVIALLMLVVTSWRALDLVEPVRQHLRHLSELHQADRDVQHLLIRHISNQPPPTEKEVAKLRHRLTEIITQDHHLRADTPQGLARARAALEAFTQDPRAALVATLSEIREILNQESQAQSELIEEMHAYSLREYRIAIGAFLGLPILAFLIFLFLKGRILRSFNRLSDLLERLGSRQFVPAPVDKQDQDFGPVLESYNHLVTSLAAAEAENRRRREELEAQVKAATRTVLKQGRELAEADRLAAVGETSARIAHELRNPLAGIELGLRNLRADCEESGACPDKTLFERLDPMIGELQRMARLLTSLLEQGRRTPEQALKTNVGACVQETATLARYQTPDGIVIQTSSGEGLSCLLPRDTLRQVIFNLVLNSVQAIGENEGTVKVGAEQEGEHIVIFIEDTGSGFPEEILRLGPRMFVTHRAGGSGLGLPTVRRLVEQMGGEMELTNRAEGGARVALKLPCRSADG